jgi:hypothetical protein
MSVFEQVVMYAGVVVGVILSGTVQQYKVGEPVTLRLTWGTGAMAAVVGLIIIPQVFEKLKVDSEAPFIVRLGLFVQNGVFWQVMFSAIGKAMYQAQLRLRIPPRCGYGACVLHASDGYILFASALRHDREVTNANPDRGTGSGPSGTRTSAWKCSR